MMRLNCGLIAETEEKRTKAVALAKELVELSLHDEGCGIRSLWLVDEYRPPHDLRDMERRGIT